MNEIINFNPSFDYNINVSSGHACGFMENPTGITQINGSVTIQAGTLILVDGTFSIIMS